MDVNSPPAAFDDLFDNRQSHAAALYFVARFERLKNTKDPCMILGINPRPIVGYLKLDIIFLLLRPNLYHACLPLIMVFDGIANQVAQDRL